MAKKTEADWESVERSYRAGVLSIREIAKVHGCSDTAIRKKATAGGWERDLSEKVNAKVRTELVRTQVRTSSPQTEREIVEEAAATVVHVVRSHRTAISKGKQVVDAMMDQLMGDIESRDELEEEIEVMTADDRSGERRAKLMRAVSLGNHSTIAVNLSNAMKTWIGLERQSFSIKDEAGPQSNSLSDLIAAVNGTSVQVVK